MDSTFWNDGYQDGLALRGESPSDVSVYAIEYQEGYSAGIEAHRAAQALARLGWTKPPSELEARKAQLRENGKLGGRPADPDAPRPWVVVDLAGNVVFRYTTQSAASRRCSKDKGLRYFDARRVCP